MKNIVLEYVKYEKQFADMVNAKKGFVILIILTAFVVFIFMEQG